eukprot:Awhi_evm2s3944
MSYSNNNKYTIASLNSFSFLQDFGRGSSKTHILEIEIGDNGFRTKALADTGANISTFDRSILTEVNISKWRQENIPVKLADDQVTYASGQIEDSVKIRVDQEDIGIQPLVMDLNTDDYKVILGVDDLERLGIKLSGLPQPGALDRTQSRCVDLKMFEDMDNFCIKNHDELIKYLKPFLEQNRNLAITEWANLPNSDVDVDISDEKLAKIKFSNSNYIPHKYMGETEVQIQQWLKDRVIELASHGTPVNLALLAVPQYNTDGSIKKTSECTPSYG